MSKEIMFTVNSVNDTVLRIDRNREHTEIEFEYTDWGYYGVPDTESAYYGGDDEPDTLLREMLEAIDTGSDPYYDDLSSRTWSALRSVLVELIDEGGIENV